MEYKYNGVRLVDLFSNEVLETIMQKYDMESISLCDTTIIRHDALLMLVDYLKDVPDSFYLLSDELYKDKLSHLHLKHKWEFTELIKLLFPYYTDLFDDSLKMTIVLYGDKDFTLFKNHKSNIVRFLHNVVHKAKEEKIELIQHTTIVKLLIAIGEYIHPSNVDKTINKGIIKYLMEFDIKKRQYEEYLGYKFKRSDLVPSSRDRTKLITSEVKLLEILETLIRDNRE